jgi:hypothetical protein
MNSTNSLEINTGILPSYQITSTRINWSLPYSSRITLSSIGSKESTILWPPWSKKATQSSIYFRCARKKPAGISGTNSFETLESEKLRRRPVGAASFPGNSKETDFPSFGHVETTTRMETSGFVFPKKAEIQCILAAVFNF